ncbi:hypothetical protein MJT46_012604 [Ovis ammon polii x Ovis aries]|nr:hypothetical protein MJT46_012604 [Ovis ammon polii x Ovis aries]
MQNTQFLGPTGCLALDPVPGSVCVDLAPATCLPMWISHRRFWNTCFHLNILPTSSVNREERYGLEGLTLPSSTALAGATSTLGSLVGTLKGSFLLGSPAAALSTLPVGASTVVAVPVVLGAVGFTSTGITASSLAAKMMSISAIANGGGVAAGSLVATLQSVGASGLSLSSKLLVSFTGSSLVSTLVGL